MKYSKLANKIFKIVIDLIMGSTKVSQFIYTRQKGLEMLGFLKQPANHFLYHIRTSNFPALTFQALLEIMDKYHPTNFNLSGYQYGNN